MDSASQHARISHASRNALSQALRLVLWKGACVDLEDVCCVGLRKEEGSTLPALSRHVLNHDRGASIAELQHHRLEPLAIPTRGEAEGEDDSDATEMEVAAAATNPSLTLHPHTAS